MRSTLDTQEKFPSETSEKIQNQDVIELDSKLATSSQMLFAETSHEKSVAGKREFLEHGHLASGFAPRVNSANFWTIPERGFREF